MSASRIAHVAEHIAAGRFDDAELTTVKCEVAAQVLTLTLSRPEQLNAFTVEMCDELEGTFRGVNGNDEVRAVVVTGAGRAFCAGMDLSVEGNVFGLDETLRPTPQQLREHLDEPAYHDGVRDTGGRVSLSIAACLKPVIAAINGPAVGIGITMTLPMDFRIASSAARIGFVFGRIGIVAESCSSWYLPRLVGIPRALELFYTAQIIDAQQALSDGLVQSVHEPDALLSAAYGLANALTNSRSPVGTALTRQLIYGALGNATPFDAHLAESLAVYYASIADGKEGVQAFREKRAPEFTSKVSTDMPAIFP